MLDNRRCSTCVIPRSTRRVEFDEDGRCELCCNNQYEETAENETENLTLHIDEIKRIGRGRQYDCLVGLSGGRDSSYLLNLLVKKHNLRCVAAYHRTPFTPNTIDANVKRLTKELNVPLVEMDLCREKHKRFARKMINLWIERPDSVIANLACAPCKQHNHEIYRIAKNRNIGAIVFGGNSYEAFQIGSAQSKRSKIWKSKEPDIFSKLWQMFAVFRRGLLSYLDGRNYSLSFLFCSNLAFCT